MDGTDEEELGQWSTAVADNSEGECNVSRRECQLISP